MPTVIKRLAIVPSLVLLWPSIAFAGSEDAIGYFIGAFVILFIIFLLIRELNCWYWKINEMVSLLKQINTKLDQKRSEPLKKVTPNPKPNPPKVRRPQIGNIVCENCGETNASTHDFCTKCNCPLKWEDEEDEPNG